MGEWDGEMVEGRRGGLGLIGVWFLDRSTPHAPRLNTQSPKNKRKTRNNCEGGEVARSGDRELEGGKGGGACR